MKLLLTGAASFLIIYIIPATAEFVESTITDFPSAIGTIEMNPAFLKVVFALFLWGFIYFIFSKRN